MTQQTARVVANAVVGALAVGAAYFVLRDPRYRRMALRAARTALTTTLPMYIAREVQQAWATSGNRS